MDPRCDVSHGINDRPDHSRQEDENGMSCCRHIVSNFDLCGKELACSADPQRRSALAGLRHLAELKAEGPVQRAAESMRRLRATIAANQFNFSALVNRMAWIFFGAAIQCGLTAHPFITSSTLLSPVEIKINPICSNLNQSCISSMRPSKASAQFF